MSDVILRWEIDSATLATGKAESEVFNEAGFQWSISMVRRGKSGGTIVIRCRVVPHRPWKCEAKVNTYLLEDDGSFYCFPSEQLEPFCLNERKGNWVFRGITDWDDLFVEETNINGKITFEFRIRIISSEISNPVVVDPNMFAALNNRSDVVLVIGEKKLHVSKEYLAVQSPVFEALFFGDYVEKGKEEVEIKDVVYEEFLDFLYMIYLRVFSVTDRTVPHILKLADRFQIESLVDLSKNHLMQTKGLDTMKKLVLADLYRIHPLRDLCLKSFANASDLSTKLKASPEYANFSGEMKIAICERLMDLTAMK